MDKPEFNRWWKDYAGRFPSSNAWLNSLGDDVATSQLSLWFEILAPVSLDDALDVSRRMSLGTLEPVGSFSNERERTAIYVRRAAERISSKRARDQPSTGTLGSYRPARRSKRNALPMRSLLGKIVRLVESGRTREEAAAACFGEPDVESQERVKCPLCRDYGTLTVWHWRSVAAFAEDPALIEHRENRLTMSVPCSCSAGDKFVGENRVWDDDAIRYDSRHYCIADYGEVYTDSALAEFKLWAAAYLDAARHAQTQRMAAEDDDNLF